MSNEISNVDGPCRCHPIATLEYSETEYSCGRHLQTNFWKHEFWGLADLFKAVEKWARSNCEFERGSVRNGFVITPIKVTWIDWDAPVEQGWREKRVEYFCDVMDTVTQVFNRENKAKVFHKF